MHISIPKYLKKWHISIWCLIIMCTVPYQAKSQDNKWLIYELVDNITFNKVSADIEFDGYHLNLDNDTLSDYSNRYQDIEIVFSPKSKIVSSLSYKSEYRYENGVSTDTYLHHCRLYFSELFNSFKEKYGNPTEILISEKPYYKKEMKNVIGNINDTSNISNFIGSDVRYFEIYWKDANRNVCLAYYGGESSTAEFEMIYQNCNNEKIKNEEVVSARNSDIFWYIAKCIGIVSLIVILAIIITMKIRQRDMEKYQQALEQIEKKKEEDERKKEIQRQRELKHEQAMREYGNYLSSLKAKYGNCEKSIRLHSRNPDEVSEILVFGQSKHLIIEKKELPFSDILDCTYNDNVKETETVTTYRDNSSATTRTNTGSMIGRSVAGGLLFGGVGAIVGGSTAKKDTIVEHGTDTAIHNKEIEHNYTVAITVKDISNPVINIYVGSDTALKDEIVSLMKVIISMK